jgi:hypothetical protein
MPVPRHEVDSRTIDVGDDAIAVKLHLAPRGDSSARGGFVVSVASSSSMPFGSADAFLLVGIESMLPMLAPLCRRLPATSLSCAGRNTRYGEGPRSTCPAPVASDTYTPQPMSTAERRCVATTTYGRPCDGRPVRGHDRCAPHLRFPGFVPGRKRKPPPRCPHCNSFPLSGKTHCWRHDESFDNRKACGVQLADGRPCFALVGSGQQTCSAHRPARVARREARFAAEAREREKARAAAERRRAAKLALASRGCAGTNRDGSSCGKPVHGYTDLCGPHERQQRAQIERQRALEAQALEEARLNTVHDVLQRLTSELAAAGYRERAPLAVELLVARLETLLELDAWSGRVGARVERAEARMGQLMRELRSVRS